jgi:hypothetical protein
MKTTNQRHSGISEMEEDDTKIRADTLDSLANIRAQYPAPLFSILLDIQKHKTPPKGSLWWIKNLECLYRIDSREPDRKRHRGNNGRITERKRLGRRCINAFNYSERNYVAVSYTCEPSTNEDTTVGGYYVESRQTKVLIPSEVRNGVLDYCNRELFWLDQECINQKRPKEMEAAIQSMDQVYSFSNFPVALLSVRIESEKHMGLLTELLHRKFVRDKQKTASTEFELRISPRKAWEALELLKLLTSDPWWTRAWTFQEDYRASTKMTLLISHHPSLEDQKRNARGVLGDLPGEICVKSADFRSEATKFCMAYRKRHGRQHEGICQNILERAGKYNILLRETDGSGCGTVHRPMSPTIFADIGGRGITKDSDRLAIAANCCGYSIRLNTETLRAEEYSLSLSMLALYFLNGEIVMNDGGNNRAALSDRIFDFMKEQTLSSFRPPVEGNELTFIKGCRFLDVKLLKEGIETAGHFWKLGRMITRNFSDELPFEIDSSHGLRRDQRRRLRQLANSLNSGEHGGRYTHLADDIDSFLEQDARLEGGHFSKQYKDLMAEEVIQAIIDGKSLRLACLVLINPEQQSEETCSPYRGIFVSEAGGEWERVPSYVFTASCPAGESPSEIDKHVSLEVDWPGSESKNRPRLITKRWINGLCFFDGYPRRKVVFPWPPSMAK